MLENQSVKNKKPRVKAGTKTQGMKEISNSNSTTPSEIKAKEELNGSKNEQALRFQFQIKVLPHL